MSVRDRYLANVQTKGANANPRHRAIISRQSVQILSPEHLVFTLIAEGTFSRVAVAIKRPSVAAAGSMAYIAGINGGAAKIYALPLTNGKPTQTPTLWQTIAGAVDVALAFEGTYSNVARTGRVEFTTIGDPWVFWSNSSGDVYARHGTGTDELVASSAVSISAIMGVASIGGSISQGLVLAYCTAAGAVFTRQYLDGMWETAVQVGYAPANIVDLALTRTWDYRLALLTEDSSGAIDCMITRSAISANANIEHIQVKNLKADVGIGQILTREVCESERVDISSVTADATAGYTEAPLALSATNIDDGTGNYGTKVRIVFDTDLANLGTGGAWKLVDAAENEFAGASIEYEEGSNNVLIVTLADFNNAANPVTLQYAAELGDLSDYGRYVIVEDVSVEFSAIGLVPTAPPVPESYSVTGNTTLEVAFDGSITAEDWEEVAAAMSVSGIEPYYSPGGGTRAVDYVISTVELKGGTTDTLLITLTSAGRLKHPQGNVTIAYNGTGGLTNGGGTLQVASFSGSADPTGEIDLFFNPHDPEAVEIAAVAADVNVGQVEFEKGYKSEAVEIYDVSAIVGVGHAEDLQV